MPALTKLMHRLPWPSVARVAWLLVAGLSLGLLVALAPINVRTVYLNWLFNDSYPAVAGFMTRAAYAAYFVGLNYAVAVISIGVAILIQWRRATEPVAWLASVLLIAAPVAFDLGGYAEQWSYYPPLWRPVFEFTRSFLVAVVALPSLLAFLYLFPNSRPRTRWPAMLLGVALSIVTPAGVWLIFGKNDDVWGFWASSFLAAILTGGSVQLYRYLRLSSPLERQQTKWVVAGMAALIVSLLGLSGLHEISENTVYASQVLLVTHHIQLLLLAFFPLALAFSILRYRLWDIDVIVRRTLIYAVMTTLLAATYFSSVLVLESILRPVTGQGQSGLVVVVSTLAIAALFVPLRRWVQHAIDRRFYRRKYDAARTLAGFAAGARDETNLDQLSTHLIDVVDQTMQPARVSLWLRSTTPTPSGKERT